jgi:hypothetical protein
MLKIAFVFNICCSRNWGGDVEVDLDDEANAEVICVSSGTKCINGEQLSLEGCVINDSHAEIVTRFRIYYFHVLNLHFSSVSPRKT